jgi:hypothetical protein
MALMPPGVTLRPELFASRAIRTCHSPLDLGSEIAVENDSDFSWSSFLVVPKNRPNECERSPRRFLNCKRANFFKGRGRITGQGDRAGE